MFVFCGILIRCRITGSSREGKMTSYMGPPPFQAARRAKTPIYESRGRPTILAGGPGSRSPSSKSGRSWWTKPLSDKQFLHMIIKATYLNCDKYLFLWIDRSRKCLSTCYLHLWKIFEYKNFVPRWWALGLAPSNVEMDRRSHWIYEPCVNMVEYTTCQWLVVESTELCGKRCVYNIRGIHRAQLLKRPGTEPHSCRRCSKGT